MKQRNNLYPWVHRFFVKAGVMLLLVIFAGGCKTTVKNYQDAYEVARQKRSRDEERHRQLQADLGVDNSKLVKVDDEASARMVLTDSVTGQQIEVKAVRGVFHRKDNVAPIAVAVAKFKMPTNAESLAADLQAEGFSSARKAGIGDDFCVIIAEGADPADVAREAIRFSQQLPEFPYIGYGEMTVVCGR